MTFNTELALTKEYLGEWIQLNPEVIKEAEEQITDEERRVGYQILNKAILLDITEEKLDSGDWESEIEDINKPLIKVDSRVQIMTFPVGTQKNSEPTKIGGILDIFLIKDDIPPDEAMKEYVNMIKQKSVLNRRPRLPTYPTSEKIPTFSEKFPTPEADQESKPL